MTLIVCLFLIFLNNGTLLNMHQQRNVAVVNVLIVTSMLVSTVVIFLLKIALQKLLTFFQQKMAML